MTSSAHTLVSEEKKATCCSVLPECVIMFVCDSRWHAVCCTSMRCNQTAQHTAKDLLAAELPSSGFCVIVVLCYKALVYVSDSCLLPAALHTQYFKSCSLDCSDYQKTPGKSSWWEWGKIVIAAGAMLCHTTIMMASGGVILVASAIRRPQNQA